jgi:hypothetical protein
MKKLSKLCYLMLIALLSSCGGDNAVSSSVSSITIDETGANDSVMIIGADNECEILASPSWMDAAVINDTVITYNVSENKDSIIKEGCLLVQCGDTCMMIPVIQGITPSYLMITDKEVKMDREGDTVRVAVVTDGGKVNIESMPEVKSSINGNYLTIISEKNDGKQITGEIKLTSGKLSETIKVTISGDVCPTCNSTGYVKCPKCKGTGDIFSSTIIGYFGCKTCGGKGLTERAGDQGFRKGSGKVPCPTCKGKK